MNDVFDFFGDDEIDPALRDSLDALRDAVLDLRSRSRGYTREPDLRGVSDAVKRVLEAVGEDVAAGAAEDWRRYEESDRDASRRQTAWALSDAIFRVYMDGAGREGVSPRVPLGSGQPGLPFSGPSRPPHPEPDDSPDTVPPSSE